MAVLMLLLQATVATTLSPVQVDHPAAYFDYTTKYSLGSCRTAMQYGLVKSMMLSLLLQHHRSGNLFLGI